MKLIEKARKKFEELITQNEIRKDELTITARGLSSKEAIGNPDRDDFPLLKGNEVMIQAEYNGSFGQAFTDHPGNFRGKLAEVLDFDLKDNYYRALFIAALNAVLKDLNLAEKTVHCRDQEPTKCAEDIIEYIQQEEDFKKLGIIGYQPAITAAAAADLGADKVVLTDLNSDLIGQRRDGVKVLDGSKDTEKLIKESDLILATGSSMINGTIDQITDLFNKHNKNYYFFGNTIAGAAVLLDLPRLCFYGHN